MLSELRVLLIAVVVAGATGFMIYKGETAYQDAPAEARSPGGGLANPTRISGDQSLYRAENAAAFLRALRGREATELLEFGLLPFLGRTDVRRGERAEGFDWYAKEPGLRPREVTISGSETLEGRTFPLRVVDPAVPARIAAAVEERRYEMTNLTLRLRDDGVLTWFANAEGQGRSGIVYETTVDGRGISDPTTFVRRFPQAFPSDSAARAMRRRQRCADRARTGAAARACFLP